MKIKPKNWSNFQHYKDRSPSWIKLHKNLIDNYEFQMLPVASRAIAPMLWLLASEYKDATIDESDESIAFRLRITVSELIEAVTPLFKSSFFECYHNASTSIAKCLPREEKRREEKSIVKLQATLTDELFLFWQNVMNHPKSKLDDKRKKIIKTALKLYNAEELKQAITGCSLTPHNIGENDRNERYDGLHIIMKDAENIDRFIRNSGSFRKNKTNGVSSMPDNWDDWDA